MAPEISSGGIDHQTSIDPVPHVPHVAVTTNEDEEPRELS